VVRLTAVDPDGGRVVDGQVPGDRCSIGGGHAIQ
jgi:hypothetical protein